MSYTPKLVGNELEPLNNYLLVFADLFQVGSLEREQYEFRRLSAASVARGATSGVLVTSVENCHIREVGFAVRLALGEQFVHGNHFRLWMETGEVGDIGEMFVVLLQLELVRVEC